ncbi:MAG: hypothetical protein RL628_1897, partial [Actinomycetota bacterium]
MKKFDTQSTMRLMTWNIWHHFGPWQERQVAIEQVIAFENRQVAIEQVIAFENPDVLFLQEVHTTERQAENLAAKLGYHAAVTTSPWSMGNAILSKWPVIRFGQVQLPNAAGEPAHRRALYAILETPWGQWPVIGTHIDHRFDESHVRQLQVDAISDLVLT